MHASRSLDAAHTWRTWRTWRTPGARLIAEELLALGNRAIGAVVGPETTSTGRDGDRDRDREG